ncbi:MAG: WbqC family protein [Weeksellaceae bacterium]
MTISVMQPYIFPYIGYFQMIRAVDTFVFYDDVNFIKKGWINRNRILVNGNDYTFTVPMQKVSQNNLILESFIHSELYPEWKTKFSQTLASYKKAPYYNEIHPFIQNLLDAEYNSISDLAIKTIVEISKYLGLNTEFKNSSESYQNRGMERQERLIDICKQESATHYINALGGQELYKKEDFQKEGIRLSFIKSNPIEYKQFKNEFVPWLSIIDVLMFNSKEETLKLLDNYELI